MRTRWMAVFAVVLVACLPLLGQAAPKRATAGDNVVTLPSSSPLYEIQIMVRSGSSDDAAGKEGTASLTARALIEGGFGDPKNPTTKEKLAEIARPWGERAMPDVLVEKEATTFSMVVPRDVFPQFVKQVLRPMFSQPLWTEAEIERLRREALVNIQSRLRLENQEMLGLMALDNYVLQGTILDHLPLGTVKGLMAVTRDDVLEFYKAHYTRGNVYVAASINDPGAMQMLLNALPAGAAPAAHNAGTPAPVNGREVLIISTPNAIATGIHFGFPIAVKRGDPDYWPLFVANTFLGLHRDSFGLLYGDIREDRGYNYGDYSYVEYLSGRPYFLFPPPTTPREQQYFSVWIRPVGHQYAHFILKAATAELENFAKTGMTPAEVAESKVKARTLYLNFAASMGRRLGYKLDDLYYGMRDHGYLDTMIRDIDAVTPEQVNAAIKKYLQAANLKYVITTNTGEAQKLANDIANNTNATPKTLQEYHIAQPIPPEKQKMLEQDKLWVAYPLNIGRDRIRVVSTDQMFETNEIPGVTKAAPAGAGQ